MLKEGSFLHGAYAQESITGWGTGSWRKEEDEGNKETVGKEEIVGRKEIVGGEIEESKN